MSFLPFATDEERAAAVEVLRQAQAELVVRGRTINVEVNNRGEVCMIGAVKVAATALGVTDRVRWIAHDGLADACHEVHGYGPTIVNDIDAAIFMGKRRLVDEGALEEILEDFDVAVWCVENGRAAA